MNFSELVVRPRQTAAFLVLALCYQRVISLLIEVGDGNPGMGHLVAGTAAAIDPLVRIGVIGVVGSIVIPLLDYQYCADRHQGCGRPALFCSIFIVNLVC